MTPKISLQSIKDLIRRVDWTLLLFLILFLNVKMAVKLAAILLIFLLRPQFKFGLSWKKSRLPIFYLLAILIAVVNAFIYRSFFSTPSVVVIFTGIGFWMLCFLAMHQVKLSVEKNTTPILHNTLLVFFCANILFSYLNIATIIFEIGDTNPYKYQGNYQKYFIGTGDYIKGISFDTSTTNAVINAFAVAYFLMRDKFFLVVAGMLALLLAASNFTNIILLATLGFMFIFKSTRPQKSMVIVCSAMLVIFFTKVSPQNSTYVSDGINRLLLNKKTAEASVILTVNNKIELSEEGKKRKIAQQYLDSLDIEEAKSKLIVAVDTAKTKPIIPTPSIHSEPFQRKKDTSAFQQKLQVEAKANHIPLLPSPLVASKSKPGKLTATYQTINFLKANPAKIINGSGMGNFSSKLAFRSTALNIGGGYPASFKYIHPDFKDNHLALFLSYFTKDRQNHSIINTPNSTYDQLISEYGLLGVAAFMIFYLGFFARHLKQLTYGLPVLAIMAAMFLVDYWFEQLSVVIIFELLLFLNIKEMQEKRIHE